MTIQLSGGRIREIVSVIPSKEISFLNEFKQYGFPYSKAIKMHETFGFDKRRVATDAECASDLAHYGLEYMFSSGLKRSEVGALIVVTQTPDHFMPGTSFILHGKLSLNQDVLCFDLNQGCNGFIYGLFLAYRLIGSLAGRVVLIVNADTLSRCTSDKDFKINPMIGDAATVTVVEPCMSSKADFLIRSDGKRAELLSIPAGAFRMPSSAQTRQMHEFPDGCKRSLGHFTMNGSSVFTFTQTDVPLVIKDVLGGADTKIDDIDMFFFHQPNRFLLDKLATSLKIPTERMPSDIVTQYGNQSGASIPHTICHAAAEAVTKRSVKSCMAGFGVGLSWGAVVIDVGPLKRAEIICKPLPDDCEVKECSSKTQQTGSSS